MTDIHREWIAFREEADRLWETEVAEETRLRLDVLPVKELNFSTPVSYPKIIVEQNVDVPMRDGCILRADIFRPAEGGCYPVTLTRTPYDKCSTLDDLSAVARNLARRGYVCICQDVRGRYASDGDFAPFEHEIEDGVDTVEWAAQQSWSNGRVGMFGISYGGWNSYAAAIGQAPHLRCIMPGMIEYPLQIRRSGVTQLQGIAGWMIWAANGRELGNPLRIDNWHLPLHEIDDKAGITTKYFKPVVTNDFTVSIPCEVPMATANTQLAKIQVPATVIAGWYDELISGSLTTWQKLAQKNPGARLVIGPWHHNLCDMDTAASIGQVPTKEIELRHYYEEMERLFETHLKEGKATAAGDSPVRIFVMGENIWRDEVEWPLTRAVVQNVFLQSLGEYCTQGDSGSLNWATKDDVVGSNGYTYDPLNPVTGSEACDVFALLSEMGNRDAIAQRDDVLVYSSPVVDKPVEVTGTIEVALFAESDCEDTDFIATLVDVYPDGHTQYLTHGIIRARYRNGVDKPVLVEPGAIHKYAFEMRPVSNVFLPGHRIRLEITSSDFSRYSRNQNVSDEPGATANVRIANQKIYHGGEYASHITLPVIPAQIV